MMRVCPRRLAPVVLVSALLLLASPPPARAFDPAKPICTLAGLVSGLVGKLCSAVRHAGTVLKAGQKLLGGHLRGAVGTLTGDATPTAKAITATAALAALTGWVVGGAHLVLHETASVISATTSPQLQATWFSSSYWRMAGISALLTLPFLFAAAVQALLRSDLGLLARSALAYLPLGVLGVSLAAPLTQLLLAASDELSGLVASASGFTAAGFAHVTALGLGSGVISTFPMLFAGLLAVAATMTLWVELLIRSAAVYVVVLMLPLFFAALVWPARRIWAVRAVELLLALILSKFAIVAVLSLGGAALGHTALPSVAQMLAGSTLVMLAAFTPWALLRLLPLHELAAGVEGLRGAGPRGLIPAGARAEDAYQRTEPLEDDRVSESAQPPRAAAGHQDAARSAVAGLDAAGAALSAGAEPEATPAGAEPEATPATTAPEAAPAATAPVATSAATAPEAASGERFTRPTVELGPDALSGAQIVEPVPRAAEPYPPVDRRAASLDPWPAPDALPDE